MQEKNTNPCCLPDLKGRRVLVMGGLGFIGSNLVHKCLEQGAEVMIYDCLNPQSGGNPYNIHDIKDDVELCYHDILDFGQVSQYVQGRDLIFNCAASTSHLFSMKEPWSDLDVNGRGVINLLEAIRRFNKDVRFIHLGTSTQLGRLHYRPANEDHPEFPTDIYSANKSLSEKYVLIYANAYQIDASVIRLSNVFGPRASIHSPDFTFNNYFIGLVIQDKDITVFGDGAQKRNLIYVEDVVEAIMLLSQLKSVENETYFVVGDDHYSVAEIAEATVKIFGSGRVRFVSWPEDRESVDVGDAIISNEKIKATINWVPKYNLYEGLKKTKAYYKNCLDKYLR